LVGPAQNGIIARAAKDGIVAQAAIGAVIACARGQAVIAAVPCQRIGLIARCDGVVTFTAAHQTRTIQIGQKIIAVAAVQRVLPRAAGDRVIRAAAQQAVIACAAVQLITVFAAVDGVITQCALQRVLTFATGQTVIAIAAGHGIVAQPGHDRVVARTGIYLIIARAGGDQIVARAGLNTVIIRVRAGRQVGVHVQRVDRAIAETRGRHILHLQRRERLQDGQGCGNRLGHGCGGGRQRAIGIDHKARGAGIERHQTRRDGGIQVDRHAIQPDDDGFSRVDVCQRQNRARNFLREAVGVGFVRITAVANVIAGQGCAAVDHNGLTVQGRAGGCGGMVEIGVAVGAGQGL
jgi:hypothetical protein